ncbi:MAG: hypothetical protein U9Q82_05530 [Chloroflexota bacterium]|nr:hypothetical protein [Chloroflexota bacterium]
MTDRKDSNTEASGERGIAAGGDVTGSTLITGDIHVFNIRISKLVLKRVLKRVLKLMAVFSVVIIAIILVYMLINICAPVVCPPSEGYTFASASLDGWQIRHDGETSLGESLKISADVPCTSKKDAALALKFQFMNYGTAQIGLEEKNVSLTEEMSAWVLVPEDGPDTLATQCFVLDNIQSSWIWFDTDPSDLPVGQWTKITCALDDFRPNAGWNNPPIMVGMQFYDTEKKEYLATVYIDSIIIQ